MPTLQTLLTFTIVSAGIMFAPGPSNFFLLAQGIGRGRRVALAAAAGVEAAALLRVVAAATGLSAVLATSATVFEVIRWGGVGYLVFLGVRAWRAGTSGRPDVPGPVAGAVGRGFAVGLGNPKMIIFYVAFFPQFIEADRGSEVGQMFLLGGILWLIGAAWDVALVWMSGAVGAWLRARPRIGTAQPRIEAAAFLGLAGWAAWGSAG